MTVNVKALINNFGQTYEALFDAGYIPCKSKPKGDSGSPYLDLDMAKEGVILTFERSSKALIEVGLTLIREENPKYSFPNELPNPLWPNMHRPEVGGKFGKPANFHPPFEVVMMRFGGADHYIMRVGERQVSMILTYNLAQMATHVTFQPTERVEWKELDPSLLL